MGLCVSLPSEQPKTPRSAEIYAQITQQHNINAEGARKDEAGVGVGAAIAAAAAPRRLETAAEACEEVVPPLHTSSAAAAADVDLVARLAALVRALSELDADPLLALPEAAERIAAALGADLVGICAYTGDENDDADDGGQDSDAPVGNSSPSAAAAASAASHAEPPAAVAALLAAFGAGAATLEERPILGADDWPGAVLPPPSATANDNSSGSACNASGGALIVPDARAAAGALPPGLDALQAAQGLACFAVAPVGAAGARPVGALLLGGARAAAPWCSPAWLAVATAALLQHLRPPHAAAAARLLRGVEEASGPVGAIEQLLRGGAAYVRQATNLTMGLRLALLEPGAGDGSGAPAAVPHALLFELAPPPPTALMPPTPLSGGRAPPPLPPAGGARRGTATPPRAPSLPLLPTTGAGDNSMGSSTPLPWLPRGGGDVAVRQLSLDNTLLASALATGHARFVEDAVAYLQNNPAPARDVWTAPAAAAAGGAPVAAALVLPLLGGGLAGGLYFTAPAPCDFGGAVRGALLGLASCIQPTLERQLAGRLPELAALAAVATPVGSTLASPRTTTLPPAPSDTDNSGSSPSAGVAAVAHNNLSRAPSGDASGVAGSSGPFGAPPPRAPSPAPFDGRTSPALGLSRAGSSSRLVRAPSSRGVSADAMARALAQDVRARFATPPPEDQLAALTITEKLGAGGFGTVYKGTYERRAVAVKVLHARGGGGGGAGGSGEAVSAAVEMAVLTSVAHPNIVGVYAAFGDVVEVAAGDGDNAAGGGLAGSGSALAWRPPVFRRLEADEDPGAAPVHSLIVLEYCDRGTLADALLRQRRYHTSAPPAPAAVDLPALLELLLAAAHALRHLHALGLSHGDVKLDNVLLRSDATAPLGYSAKLADFGLARLLCGERDVINLFGAGTATHLAPELLRPGTRVTTACDTHAWGVVMWECFTAKRAYAGLPRAAVIQALQRGARPTFPAAAPAEYARLAAACWAPAPEDRPTMAEVCRRLQALAEALAGAGGGGGAATV